MNSSKFFSHLRGYLSNGLALHGVIIMSLCSPVATANANMSPASPNAQALARRLWPDAHALVIAPTRRGLENFDSMKVTVDGVAFHIKMSRDRAGMDAPAFAREVENDRFAAEHDLAPKVVFADVGQGILVTEFVADEMRDWHEGMREPKLSAMLHFMATMHATQRRAPATPVDVDAMQQRHKTLLAPALALYPNDARLLQLETRLPGVIERLRGRSFYPTWIHGDFHQYNFLYRPGRCVMVDWADSRIDDPMADIGLLSFFIERSITQLSELLGLYGDTVDEDLLRAEVYATVYHVEMFLEEVREISNDDEGTFEERRNILWARIAEDFAHLPTDPLDGKEDTAN